MDKVTLTIELKAKEMSREKLVQLLEMAGQNLVSGAKAVKEGDIDQESKDRLDKIIEDGQWWMAIKERKNLTIEFD